jgi:hypothetical protein
VRTVSDTFLGQPITAGDSLLGWTWHRLRPPPHPRPRDDRKLRLRLQAPRAAVRANPTRCSGHHSAELIIKNVFVNELQSCAVDDGRRSPACPSHSPLAVSSGWSMYNGKRGLRPTPPKATNSPGGPRRMAAKSLGPNHTAVITLKALKVLCPACLRHRSSGSLSWPRRPSLHR